MMSIHKLKIKICKIVIVIGKKIKHSAFLSFLCFLTVLCCIFLIVIPVVLKLKNANRLTYTISIDTQGEPVHILNEKFLSLGLDSSVITSGFSDFNMSDPVLIKMIQHLSPAYLRIGGNQADQIVFSEGPVINTSGEIFRNYTLSGDDWLQLYALSQNANISIIYDLNALLRFENGTWDYQNAIEMIEFSEKNNLKVDWELGNEPNSYRHKFNKYVNATQLGFDYITLRDVLNKTQLYKNSYLIGPSTTRLRDEEVERYFRDFLTVGAGAVSAITFHHYYFSGENATSVEFLNPDVYNYLEYHINIVKSVVNELDLIDKPIWLGETSSAWHSGAPNLSNRFIGTFIWMDKLGLSAKMGIDLLVRQSIFKGYYALIDNNYEPNPDWWISVAYNKFVSRYVLATKTAGNERVRLYTHCAKKHSFWPNAKAPVIVFGININSQKVTITIDEVKTEKEIYVYEFTGDQSLYSQRVRLNGDIISLGKNQSLPVFKPKVLKNTKEVTMLPYSVVFWILPDSNVAACANL
ncbi:hypothetical protein GWI33_000271 [Rhynchophorus ferrugineus]|uniref:Heparanase-like protein n=1 Tax=Rhynchophorus ferrugineus TaxID=354439 RepID=A0A834IWY0_RHYFE|nr:hypothetical protein GWI33_000271 [Rhynchophorus ferrugineus]